MNILIASGVAVLSAAMFQMPAKPPMKMGLWESTSVTTMVMPDMPNMPGMGAPRTNKVRSCMTPESYAKNFYNRPQSKDCTRANESWTGNKYSFDIVCPAQNGSGHFEITMQGEEAGHGTMHMKMSPGGHTMTMDMTTDTHFVSSDCGSVTPDKPEILK